METSNFEREKYLIHAKMGNELVELFKRHGVLLCGGAITSLFSAGKIRDWDLYFRSEESFTQVREAFIANGKELSRTDLAMTYSWGKKQRPFQLIHGVGYFSNPSDVFNHYDYTICMGGYDFSTGAFFFDSNFMKHIAQRRLVFNHKTDFPLCSLIRAGKYVARGFTVSGVEMLKIGLAVQAVKITNYGELRQQMMGIDTAFLKDLTDRFLHPDVKERQYELEAGLHYIDEHMQNYSHLAGADDEGGES